MILDFVIQYKKIITKSGGIIIMKKKVILIIILVLVIFYVATFVVSRPSEEANFSRGEVPQTGNGFSLTVEERMEYIKDNPRDGVVIGTPIEFVRGELVVRDFFYGDERMAPYHTEYYFQVIDWLWGEGSEEIIRVRTNSGNIFEIGGEYTLSFFYVNQVLERQPIYSINWQIQTLDNSEVSESRLQEFHEDIRNLPPSEIERSSAIENAIPTLDFLYSVNVVLIGTVYEVWPHTSRIDAYSVRVNLQDVIYGEISDYRLKEPLRMINKVTVGNSYLMILGRFESPAARHGSIIPVGSPEFYEWMEFFEQVNQNGSQ